MSGRCGQTGQDCDDFDGADDDSSFESNPFDFCGSRFEGESFSPRENLCIHSRSEWNKVLRLPYTSTSQYSLESMICWPISSSTLH